jgi:hypothetical protein
LISLLFWKLLTGTDCRPCFVSSSTPPVSNRSIRKISGGVFDDSGNCQPASYLQASPCGPTRRDNIECRRLPALVSTSSEFKTPTTLPHSLLPCAFAFSLHCFVSLSFCIVPTVEICQRLKDFVDFVNSICRLSPWLLLTGRRCSARRRSD